MTSEHKFEATSPFPIHPEPKITDAKEQALLAQFDEAKGIGLEKPYKQLMKALASTSPALSNAARQQVANHCYAYWARTLLSQTEVSELQTEQQRGRDYFKGQVPETKAHPQTEKRCLFRSADPTPRFYWGRLPVASSIPHTAGVVRGRFLECYPHFQHGMIGESESVKAIDDAIEITDATVLAQCQRWLEMQQRQRRQDQLWVDMETLRQGFLSQNNDSMIAHLQLAQLCLHKGYLGQDCFAAFQGSNAIYYLKPALQAYLDQRWTGAPATFSGPLMTAVTQLRDDVDEALVHQAQTLVVATQLRRLELGLQTLWDNFSVSACYDWVQAMGHAMTTFARFAAPRALFARFTERLAVDESSLDILRGELDSEVTSACNASKLTIKTLRLLSARVVLLVSQLQQHDSPRALALLHWYQDCLTQKRAKLQERFAQTPGSNPHKAYYQAALADCQMALADCEALTAQLPPSHSANAAILVQQQQARLTAHAEQLTKHLAAAPDNTPEKAYYQVTLTDCQTAIAQCQTLQTSAASQPAVAGSSLTSGFAKREAKLIDWHRQTAEALAQNEPISALQARNTQFAKTWFADLCAEVERQIGAPPCAFTLIGSGSLSRGEVSICSDIDFQLLVADSSSQNQPYFQAFLKLLTWKALAMPREVLKIESNTLGWINSKQWWGTPEELIAQHLYLPIGDDRDRIQQPENFNVQWLTPLYASQTMPTAPQALFHGYQDKLNAFFRPKDAIAPYPHQLQAPWSLQQHLTRQTLSAPKADNKDSATLKTVHLKSVLYPITNALLCYARFMGIAGITDTQQILDYLREKQFLSLPLLTRINEAITDLHHWRLVQHWASVHYPHPAGLSEDEVFVWPSEVAQQTLLSKMPTGFYLTAAQSARLQEIQTSVVEVIRRSVSGFAMLKALAPLVGARHAVPVQDDPIAPSSSYTTTTVSETKEIKKEAKREVPQHDTPTPTSRDLFAGSSESAAFNPIDAAITHTLHRLSEASPREAQVDVDWLADCLSRHANELAEPPTYPSDPTDVRNDACLHRYWRVFWQIPQELRLAFIQRLQAPSPTERQQTIVQRLCYAPTASGQRLRWLQDQIHWQEQSLPRLWDSKAISAGSGASSSPTAPTISIVRQIVVNGQKQWQVETYPLKPEICAQLFQKNGEWRPKDPSISGNHRVYPIEINSQICFWVKAYPEQPASEFLVTELDRRLGVWGTPQMELVKFHHGGQTSAAVITEAVQGLSLRSVMSDTPQQLGKLDFTSFMRTLWRVLLTNPEDDKDDDYFLVPQADGSLQLVRIDNERAFFQPTSAGNKGLLFKPVETLQVKSVLYCLEQMRSHWHSDNNDLNIVITAAIDECLQLQPIAVISDLLTQAQAYHAAWNQLFSAQEVAAHFERRPPEVSIPAMCIPQGLAKELITRLTAIHNALRFSRDARFNRTPLTGLSLLAVTQPKLAAYYAKAHPTPADSKAGHTALGLDHAQVRPRFHQVVGALYKKDAKGGFSSQMPGTIALQTSLRMQSTLDKSTLQAIRNSKSYSPKQELDQFLSWQTDQLTRLRSDLLMGYSSAVAAFQGLPLRHQQLLWQELKKPLQAKTLSQQQQAFLLQAMTGAPWPKLNLSLFDVLAVTEPVLQSLLEAAGEHLLELDISGCTSLRATVVETIQRYCPQLQRLTMNNQTKWKSLIINNLPTLIHLEINNASALTQLSFNQLPALQRLSLQQTAALTALADYKGGILSTRIAIPWHLPALQQLDIRGCRQLRTVRLWVEHPEQLSMQTAGCEQLQLPQIQSPQHTTPMANYVTHLASEKQLSTFLTELFKRQWLLAALPRLAIAQGKALQRFIDVDYDLYTKVYRLHSTIKTSLSSMDAEYLVREFRYIMMLLAMSLFAHDKTAFAFTATSTNQQAYVVWEAILQLLNVDATKAAAYAQHLPALLPLNSKEGLYQLKDAENGFWLASALTEMAQADKSFQTAALQFFNQRPIQDAPDAVNLLAERVQSSGDQPPASYTALRRLLFGTIARSAREPQWAQASSNAATLLNACQEPLSHQAWAGVQLAGADLRYSVLAHSDLRGANLRGAQLMRSVLYQSNLTGADLQGARWGEFPRLELKENVQAVAWHPTQPIVAVAQDKTILQFNSDTGEQVGAPLTGHTGKVTSVAYRPDGRRLVSGSDDETVRQWDAETGKPIGAPLTGHMGSVHSVAYRPDGRRLASGGVGDCTVRQWDTETGKPIGAPLTGHTGKVTSVAYRPDSRRLVSASSDQTLRQWDAETGQALGAPLTGHADGITSVAYRPDGRRLVSGSRDNTVRQWDAETGKQIGTPLTGHTIRVDSVAYRPDSRRLVSGSRDNTVRQWDAETGQAIGAPLTGHTHYVTSVAYRPDGKRIVSGSWDNTVRQWDAEMGQAIGAPLTGHTHYVTSVAYRPDGRRLVSGSIDNTLRQWDAETGQPIGAPLTGHTRGVTSVAYRPDGRRLVSASHDNTVRQWDAETGEPIGAPLTGHTGWVTSVAYRPDGKRIVSGSWDNTVRLWDADSHRCLAVLQWHQAVNSVAFCPLNAEPNPVSAGSKAVVTRNSAAKTAEYQLAIGDEAGTVSIWAISAEHPEQGFYPVSMNARIKMPLMANGAILKDCRMSTLSKRLLAQHGGDVSQVIVDDSDALADSKTSQPLATSQTTTSSPANNNAAFFPPAPRSQPIETKETKEERKGVPKDSQTQACLNAVLELMDKVYPADDPDHANKRTHYLGQLAAFQQRVELTPEDLTKLEIIEKELQAKQAASINSPQPMG